MGFAYSFSSQSGSMGSAGDIEWRLNWIAIDPPGAPPVTRVLSEERMGELKQRFGVLNPTKLFTEAEIDLLLDPN